MTATWRRRWRSALTVGEALVLAVSIEAALRCLSFAGLLSRLDRLRAVRSGVPDDPERLRRCVAMAYRLLPFRAGCLRESLVLYGLLRRRGASPSLRLGVALDAQQLLAHAWVECEGLREISVLPFAPLA